MADNVRPFIFGAIISIAAGMAVLAGLKAGHLPPEGDAQNIISEAIRLHSATSVTEFVRVAMNPRMPQPPLRSVPLVIVMWLTPFQFSMYGLNAIYEILWRLALMGLVAGVGLYITRVYSWEAGLTATVANIILLNPVTASSWFIYGDNGYYALAMPFAFATVASAWYLTKVETFRARVVGIIGMASTAWIATMIDTQPAQMGILIASIVLLSATPPRWREWLATGALGLLMTLPVSGSATSGISDRVENTVYIMRSNPYGIDLTELVTPVLNIRSVQLVYVALIACLFAASWSLEDLSSVGRATIATVVVVALLTTFAAITMTYVSLLSIPVLVGELAGLVVDRQSQIEVLNIRPVQ